MGKPATTHNACIKGKNDIGIEIRLQRGLEIDHLFTIIKTPGEYSTCGSADEPQVETVPGIIEFRPFVRIPYVGGISGSCLGT